MRKNIAGKYQEIDKALIQKTKWSVYDFLLLTGCIIAGIFMIVRCFFGTEITDEAYYVADAKAMLEGNLPYAYCNYSLGSGSAFLMIPFIAVYKIFQPDFAGVFLYTRLCFIMIYFAILFIVYRVLIKNIIRSHVLLFIGLLIPFKAGPILMNFSYNTVPCILTLLAAVLLYDALENKSGRHMSEIIFSGFMMGISFFAQPGYGLAILLFVVLLLVRSCGGKEKAVHLFCFAAGGIAEACIVFIPVMMQAGVRTLYAGIYQMRYPYPVKSSAAETYMSKTISLIWGVIPYAAIGVAAFIFALVFFMRYVRESGKKLSGAEYVKAAIAAGGLFMAIHYWKNFIGNEYAPWVHGMIGSIMICGLLAVGGYKKCKLLLYAGIYPVLFSAGEVIGVLNDATLTRFTNAVPTLAICLLFFLEEQAEISRFLASAMTVLCITELLLGVFTYIYRDESLFNLTFRVNEGVYKGIYTTQARQNDLPELEEYLNAYIEEGESYEFHDNVPCGYLMMHTGEVCSRATWDSLNYSRGINAPANLYEYYRRRGMIPDKIFYVDFGRDQNLSIEDSEFRYNEFIDAYYEKIDEVQLNDTFFHVIVYRYKGGFDGDFDDWIDRHMVVT